MSAFPPTHTQHTHAHWGTRFGHVFLWDSGSSVGEISGHSKLVNAIDYRPTRPFRVVTAGEDKQVGWYEGPPFKLKTMIQVHTYMCMYVLHLTL